MVEIDEIVVAVDADEAEKELEQIKATLAQLSKTDIAPTEEIVRKRLWTRKEELTGLVLSKDYPIISTRFMTAANKVKAKGEEWILPKFVPFGWKDPTFDVDLASKENIGYSSRTANHITMNKSVPEVFCEPLLKVFQRNFGKPREWEQIERDYGSTRNVWRSKPSAFTLAWSIRFSVELATLIPEEAKQRVAEVQRERTFSSLHCIAEVEPTSWTAKEVPIFRADPLIVGVLNDRVHLVAKFDPTPLENYVSKEFLK